METEYTYQAGFQIDYSPIFEVNYNDGNYPQIRSPNRKCKSKKLGCIKEESPDAKGRQTGRIMSPAEISERCQIAIEGKNNFVCIECRPVLTGSRKSV